MSHPEIGNYQCVYMCVYVYVCSCVCTQRIWLNYIPNFVIEIAIHIFLAYIVLEVEGIEPRHCKLNVSSGSVSLIVEDGLCSVNSEKIEGTRDLCHGE